MLSFVQQVQALDSEERGGRGQREFPFGAGGSQNGFYEGVGSWEES